MSNRRTAIWLIPFVFVLHQAAQLSVTPLNEGMDFEGHLAYTAFVADRGLPPLPDELSFPGWIDQIARVVPGPDFTDGTRYQAWARLTAEERADRLAPILAPPGSNLPYVGPNYESQQPPLYYWALAVPFRLTSQISLDWRTYLLGLFSVVLASAALPAIYATLRLYVDGPSATLATLAVAWFPNLLAFLGRVTNDDLAFPLIAWAMYLMARRSRGTRAIVGAGLLLGLALLAKSYALTLVPVYVLASAVGRRSNSAKRTLYVDPRGLALATGAMVVTVGPLLLFNYLISGQALLLAEMRGTGDSSLGERLLSILTLNWSWFAQGVLQGFWWSGDFSFVVRGFYYLPLAVPAVLLVVAACRPRRLWQALVTTGVHVLALLFFVGGLAWHAGLTVLLATQYGQLSHGGSEGWYLDVLVGSAFAVGVALLRPWLSEPRLRVVLAVCAAFLVVWNLVGRMVLLLFWTGQVGPGGTLTSDTGLLGALQAAVRSLPWSTAAGASPLAGAVGPAALTTVVPLGLAIGLTVLLIVRETAHSSTHAAAPVHSTPVPAGTARSLGRLSG